MGADCSAVLREAEQALKSTELNVEIFNSQWVDVLVEEERRWTEREKALMVAIGWSLRRGIFVEEIFRLVRRTELYCREVLYQKHGEIGVVKNKVKGILLWSLFSRGGRGYLPASRIVYACQLGLLGEWSWWGDSHALERVVKGLGGLTLGELYIVCVLMRDAHDEVLRKLPELMRLCWESRVDHLRLKCLQAAQAVAGVLREPQLSEVKAILGGFEGGNVLLSTVLVDTMVSYGMLEPPIELDVALKEIEAIVDAPQDELVCEQADGVVGRMFEEVFQGVYDEALESLSAEKRARFLTRAALGASKHSIFLDWILRRLVRMKDPQALPAFLHWVDNFEPDANIIVAVAERYIWALVGCAAFLDKPPDVKHPKSGAHHAWQLCGQVVFWMNRPGLPDAVVIERCEPLWRQLESDLVLEAVEPIVEICWSPISRSKQDGGSIRVMPELFEEPIRRILENALSAAGSLPTIYRAEGIRDREQFSHIIRGLSFVGNWQSVVLLEGLVESEEHGTSAVEALKRLKKRLVEQRPDA